MNVRRAVVGAVLVVAVAVAAAAATARGMAPNLHFTVFAQTGHKLASALWTGNRFLFVENTENIVWSAPTAGTPFTHFASMPRLVEETRCSSHRERAASLPATSTARRQTTRFMRSAAMAPRSRSSLRCRSRTRRRRTARSRSTTSAASGSNSSPRPAARATAPRPGGACSRSAQAVPSKPWAAIPAPAAPTRC